jgi:hypothetical protein
MIEISGVHGNMTNDILFDNFVDEPYIFIPI